MSGPASPARCAYKWQLAKFNMEKIALKYFQIPPKREVHIFNMYIITLLSFKAVSFILFEFQITQTFCDGQTDGRSRAATRPAVTVGYAGKNHSNKSTCKHKSWRQKCLARCMWSLYTNVRRTYHTVIWSNVK